MTQVLTRALPFVVAFVFGVTCTAIVRTFLPTRHKTFYDSSRSRCKSKVKTSVDLGRVVDAKTVTSQVEITEIQEFGATNRFTVSFTQQYGHKSLMKERALLLAMQTGGYGSSPNFVVSYAPPDAIDGKAVTSDAVLFKVPRPRFWREEQGWLSRLKDCNAIVRVNLDSTGKVTEAVPIGGFADRCVYVEEIIDAAEQIRFRPALREGVPVSQRISISYKLH